MTKWIKVPQEQWDSRLESTHKHITASHDALQKLDEAISSAQKARDFLYNATVKARYEDSADLERALRKAAKGVRYRLKQSEDQSNKCQ